MVYNSILICIAFHYSEDKPNRLWFLHQTILNIIHNYKMDFHIIVDTNEEIVCKYLERYKGKVTVVVNEYLIHPYHLVWMHRNHILNNMNEYDVFMYLEDDIIVPYESILDFLEKIDYMYPSYIPCYERLEWSNSKKCFVALDIHTVEKVKKKDIIHINGKRFFTPKLPYHGFWILPCKYLQKEVDQNFLNLSIYREHASSYPLGPPSLDFAHDITKGKCDGFLNKIPLFELNENNKISNKCLVYHISNNYSDNTESHFGKIPIEDAVEII